MVCITHIHLIEHGSTSMANQKPQQDSYFVALTLWPTRLGVTRGSAHRPRHSLPTNSIPKEKRLLWRSSKRASQGKAPHSRADRAAAPRDANPAIPWAPGKGEECWNSSTFPKTAPFWQHRVSPTTTHPGTWYRPRCHHTNVRHKTELLCKEQRVRVVKFV